MRILVGWDDPEEAELIGLYLNNEHDAETALQRETLLQQATRNGPWDVILLSINFGGPEQAFATFEELRARLSNCPIVGACRIDEVVHLARYLSAGMQTYVLRDLSGDFVFLLLRTLESTVQGVQAERERQVAEKLREEVQGVRRFEQAILGENVHSPRGYSIAAQYEPSEIHVSGGRNVLLAGGDFYEAFEIDRARTGLVLADAAGHGMQACLSIAVLQTYLQLLQEGRIRSPAGLTAELNRRFCAHRIVRNQGNLVTLLSAILHVDRHELSWTSAGHPPPLLHDRDAGTFQILDGADHTGPPVGLDAGVAYRDLTCRLPPHCRLVLYTDGLTESTPEPNTGVQFGLDGVRHTLRRMADRPAADALHALLHDSHAFTRGRGRHDDTSVLILDRL